MLSGSGPVSAAKEQYKKNVEIPSTECYDEFIQVEEARAFHL